LKKCIPTTFSGRLVTAASDEGQLTVGARAGRTLPLAPLCSAVGAALAPLLGAHQHAMGHHREGGQREGQVPQREKGHGHDHQLPHRQVPQRQRDRRKQGIEHQDIAAPQQQLVSITDQQQPAEPSQLHSAAIITCCIAPVDEQQHRGPEQQGERPPHLAFEQDQIGGKGQPVSRTGRAQQARAERGRWPAGKAGYVDCQDPEHGDAAHQIQRGDPIGRRAAAHLSL